MKCSLCKGDMDDSTTTALLSLKMYHVLNVTNVVRNLSTVLLC